MDPPNPDYVTAATSAGQLRALVADHVRTVMGRFRGRHDYLPKPAYFGVRDALRGRRGTD